MTNHTPGSAGEASWDDLTRHAVSAMHNAYAPYSRFKVGVAALVDDGRVVTGCNVENASYGLGLCAECGLVSSLHASGGGTLVAIVCVDQHSNVLMPCGRCRQILFEHSDTETQIMTPLGRRFVHEILPQAFGPRDLIERAEDVDGD
ncbi:MAG: cytidine deaminase [Ilumatobacteraceae bacterium]